MLNREKQLPIDDALQVTKEVADALGYAHMMGIVHRDIKPENILFEAGHAVVSDFGIARAVTEAGGETLTETGLAVGTPAYMSPEQATASKDLDARTDIYSLGCVLYEMLAGEPPYTGPTAQAMMARKLGEPLPRISVIREAVPGHIEDVLAKALDQTPADRYRTAGGLAEGLASPSTVARPEPARPGRSRRGIAILGVAAILAVGALALKTLGGSAPAITTSNIRQVTRAPGIEFEVAISPDGDEVAYSTGVVRATGGAATQLVGDGSLNQSPVWLPDSRHLLFVSDRGGSREVYVVAVGSHGARSEPQPVAGGSNAHTISVGASGRRLAYSKAEVRANVWAYPLRETRTTADEDWRPVTQGNQTVELLGLSPGGDSIVFDSNINGNQDIFKQSIQGGQIVPLTRDAGDDFGPDWSPDGSEIAFYSTRPGNRDVWVMAADGSSQQQLTRYAGWDSHPSWSPDGRTIVFQSRRSGTFAVWSVTRESVGRPWSEPVQVSDLTCFYPNGWTPDGKAFVCETPGSWAVVSREGVTVLAPKPSEYGFDFMRLPTLGPDGASVSFVGGRPDGSKALWAMPIGGGEPRRLVTLDHGVADLAVGANAIYGIRNEFEADIWVMDLEW